MFSWFVGKKDNKEVKELQEENKKLSKKVSNLESMLDKAKSNKRLDELERIIEKIPNGARGEGSILVYQDDEYKQLEVKSKEELQKVLEDARDKKLEVVFI